MHSKSFILCTNSTDLTAAVLGQIDTDAHTEVDRFINTFDSGKTIEVKNQTVTPFKHTDGTWHAFLNITYITVEKRSWKC
jgi:hypothetical protein